MTRQISDDPHHVTTHRFIIYLCFCCLFVFILTTKQVTDENKMKKKIHSIDWEFEYCQSKVQYNEFLRYTKLFYIAGSFLHLQCML